MRLPPADGVADPRLGLVVESAVAAAVLGGVTVGASVESVRVASELSTTFTAFLAVEYRARSPLPSKIQ